jgi:hypothetical protein
MRVYLDNNIFVYLENGSLAISDLENIIGEKIDKIFFSASHIQETLEIIGETDEQRIERINIRLKTIEDITKGNYLNENVKNEVFEYMESPFEVIETITEVSFAQNAMKGLINLISEEQKKETRKILGIDPKRINNYKPEEVVEHLNKKLSDKLQSFTFLSMIEQGISYHPDVATFGRSNRIAAIFELLDMLGYWKDTPNHKSNYARLWDSSHTFYASHCHYFITDDKRTKNKAKVVYSIYDIGTKVISTKN